MNNICAANNAIKKIKKMTHRLGEYICKSYIPGNELILWMYIELFQLNTKKTA